MPFLQTKVSFNQAARAAVLLALLLPTLACGLFSRAAAPPAGEPPSGASEIQLPTSEPSPAPGEAGTLPATEPPPATPTQPPSPDPTAGPEPAHFSPAEASQELPENVMEEILYFGGQGGEGDAETEDPCAAAPTGQVTLVHEPSADQPLFSYQYSLLCGWSPGESITVQVTPPGGEMRTETYSAGDYGELEYLFPADFSDQPGEYTYFFNGPGGGYALTVNRPPPDIPGAYFQDDDRSRRLFYGFQPGESLRLYVYETLNAPDEALTHMRFLGWQEYRADNDGRLFVEFQVPEPERLSFAVLGSSGTQYNGGLVACAEEPAFEPGDQAWVAAPGGANLYARDEVSADYAGRPGEVSLPFGTELELTGGPVCIEANLFWEVRAPSGDAGLVAQSQPLQGDAVLASRAPSGEGFTCPGAPPARLGPGDTAHIRYELPGSLYVFVEPSLDAGLLGELLPGSEFKILEGPVCAEGYVWYAITDPNGLEGWLAEAESDQYFIEPWPYYSGP